MKIPFLKGKSKRTRILGSVTLAAVVLLLVLNILFSHLGLKTLAYIDLTPEGYYSLTDKMVEHCKRILMPEGEEGEEKEIQITFCRAPDALVSDFEMRVTYFMALALEREFDGVTVEEVDIKYNPTAVSAYKTTSRRDIKDTDIIISYGKKYRVVSSDSFWTVNSDGSNFSYNGEYKLASILASITAINAPKAYFVTGHGESYYDPESPDSENSIANAYFADLLTERGMTVKTLNLSEVDKIPDDCAVLIINNPTEDLYTDPDGYSSIGYVSEAEKIDEYLICRLGSLIVNKDYRVHLPVLESLLSEWGIAFGEGLVKDEEREYDSPSDDDYNILGVYDTDEESFGAAFYGDFAGLSSAPDMLFKNSGYLYCSYKDGNHMQEPGTYNTSKGYAPFIGTTDKAFAIENEESTVLTGSEGYKALAAVSTRISLDSETNENSYSYIFASNSKDFYSNDVLGNTAFANYDIMASLISSISRTDRYASIELGGTSQNSPSFGGKQLVDMTLKEYSENVYSPDATEIVKVNRAFTATARGWFTAIVCIPPVAVLVLGLVMFIRRRYL